MSITITEKQIKSKIKLKDRTAVVENIKYPYFESITRKKLCDKMNSFYFSIAQKYSGYAHKKLVAKIEKKSASAKLPFVLNMNYFISVCDENVVSIVLDLSFSSGKEMRMRRFSQMWSVKKSDIAVPREIIKNDRKSRKTVFSNVLTAARENSENPSFGYYGDYLSRLVKNFDVSCFFIVPHGICFFVNAGILSPLKYGHTNFVVPFSRLSAVINEEFLPIKSENTDQNTDIVNNV